MKNKKNRLHRKNKEYDLIEKKEGKESMYITILKYTVDREFQELSGS
jgi:hypothetical protein